MSFERTGTCLSLGVRDFVPGVGFGGLGLDGRAEMRVGNSFPDHIRQRFQILPEAVRHRPDLPKLFDVEQLRSLGREYDDLELR